MAVKRKISVRKILQVLLTLVTTTCCLMAIISAEKIEDKETLKEVAIHFKNDKRYHFIQEQDIMNLAINNTHTDIAHTPVSRLNIGAMERLIKADPWVAFAQVYVDNERVLHMYVTQRIPVARVFQQNGVSYYLDTSLSIMPLSEHNIYYTSVVTNVPELKNDSASWATRKDIISLVRSIQRDSFWNAQISQVEMDSPGMYEFVPILGDQRIIFGDVNNMQEKFHCLFAFYKNVLNKIGWDKYQILDVRFRDQVVASPSLPYSGPVDKGMNTMNWINSIEKTEAINDSMKTAGKTGVIAKTGAVKPVAKPTAAAVKPAARPAKQLKKPVAAATKKQQAAKDNKANNKNKKQASPKYIYPEKKQY